ncbi:MAG: FeoA family protein [Candidatus Micrarchaeia archaeon]|jgi:Fe2+ transport system protein FeoA
MEKRLSNVEEGKKVKIVKFEGCGEVERRLMEMGLVIGSEVMVVNQTYGPVIVEVNNAKIAIGRGMAQKIIVED